MSKSEATEKTPRELGMGKIIAVILIVFTFIPIIIMSLLYFSNDNFKFIANNYLSGVPGVVGEYFSQFPTREERETQKREVAKFLLELDRESAADKLIIIQKTDTELYGELIKIMGQLNQQQTEKIAEQIRDYSLKEDILTSTLDQIKKDQLNDLKNKAQYYEKLPIVTAVEEINNSLRNDMISYKQMALVFEQMKEDLAAKILSKLDEEVSARILFNYDFKNKKQNVEQLIAKIKDRENELIQIAQIYDVEDFNEALEKIGNNQNYKLEELSVIYRNMDMIQSAKILSNVTDKDFVYSLLEQIKSDEILENGRDHLTSHIVEASTIYRDYNEKTSELIQVFSKMEVQQIVPMIETLFNSKAAPKKYSFNDENYILFSDQDIAINILKKLQPRIVADILSNMDSVLASEISKKLNLPNK